MQAKLLNTDEWNANYDRMPDPCKFIVECYNCPEFDPWASVGIGQYPDGRWTLWASQGQGGGSFWNEGEAFQIPSGDEMYWERVQSKRRLDGSV